MKVVYIAGPFRGVNAWEIAANVRRAEELSFEVAKLGAMPLCLHKNTENMHGALPDRFFLDGTLQLMRRCDAVVLTEGWERSSGARGQVREAISLGIPVLFTSEHLGRWLAGMAAPANVRELQDHLTEPG